MKNWKKFASLLLALVMCLSMAACGDNGSNGGEVSNDGEITLDDLVRQAGRHRGNSPPVPGCSR